MTAPRQIVPGQIYMINRRCTQRQFLLRPDSKTTRIFQYALGEAAAKYGIVIIAWYASSNHYHAVVYDPLGNLPLFLERFHKLCARAMNARLRRRENFWASEHACVVRLADDAAVLDKVVYTLANPVQDDLVDRVLDWPGANSLRYTTAEPKSVSVERPREFFREGGAMPDEVTLEASPPPQYQDDRAAWAELVQATVLRAEQGAREARQARHGRVLGRRRVRMASAFDRPGTPEPRRERVPHVACGCRELRLRELAALRRFRAAHREARRRFIAGDRTVMFPAGTYLMSRLFKVQCAVPS